MEEDVCPQEGEENHSIQYPLKTRRCLKCQEATGNTAEERYGNYLLAQLKPEHQRLLRLFSFNCRNALNVADRPEREPQTPEEVSSFTIVFMLERMDYESQPSFMENVPDLIQADISREDNHELLLEIKRVLTENKSLHVCTARFISRTT